MAIATCLSQSRRWQRLIVLALICFLLLLCTQTVDGRRKPRRNNRYHRRHNRRYGSGSSGYWNVGHLSGSMEGQDWEEEQITTDKSMNPPHMQIVFQWPESLCASEKRGCKGVVHPWLTLHGVWPIERHLVNCRSDFDPEQLASIERNLTEIWPSYFHHTSMSFWKHEYDKHGSCLYATIGEYFQSALSMHGKFAQPLLSLLAPGGESHPLEFWTNKIKGRFGGEPMIMCRTNWIERRVGAGALSPSELEEGYESDDESDEPPSRSKEQLLVEVGICLDQAGSVVDCPPKGRIRRCRRGKEILLPAVHTFTVDR